MESNPNRQINPDKNILFVKSGLFLSNSRTFPRAFADIFVLNYISNKSIQIITHDSLLFKSLLLII